jgi:exonuclease SbcC
MIPVKLQLQNFMAYKSQEILDFGDIHVACLTGENGAGKSTLLDAITWALWGKARTRLDDDLIHLGESEMEVEFTFSLGKETYRALRRRSAAKRGKSELHFHVYVEDAGGWRTLTEASIRETQAKINRLLRLDYDTFINSAFLLQGRADEFTTKRPAERKQILGDILGLGIYDEYEEKAAEKNRYYAQEIKILEAQLEQMDREMANEAAYRAEWEENQNRAATLNKALREAEGSLNDLRQRHKELDLKQRQLDDLQGRLEQAQADLEELSQTCRQTQTRIDRYQAIIAQKEDIEAGHQKLQQAQTEQEDWNNRLAQSSSLSAEQHRLETIVNRARAKLETDIKVKHSRLEELKPKAEAAPDLQVRLTELDAQLAELHTLEAERETNRQKLNDLNTESARLEEENKQLKGEMNKIKERLTQLEEAGSTCPVCTQPLSETHRQEVYDQFTAEGTVRGDAFRANKVSFEQIQEERQTLEVAIKQADQALRKLASLQAQQVKVEHSLQEAEEASQIVASLEEDLADLQKQLAEGQFEPETAAQLKQIREELVGLGYDAKAHQVARTRVSELARYADDVRQLEDAQNRLEEERTRLNKEQARQNRLLAQTAADQETIERLVGETETLPQVVADLTAVSAQVDDLQRQERLARDAVAAARQKLDHLAYLAKERGNREMELAELREAQAIYKELRLAFGKRGVQALLIEHAIPELEQEANAILSRMTDGRVNLQFITQRTTKTGESTIETLDIRIADELGTRNYELYSGGEAFRVNFAIRIALSKLLARRAGASLQTLVVDEGFGTQDAQGRERLVEAINSIQTDFEKIIVITHIDELQGAFPTQISVHKTDQGSRITVV